RAAARRGVRARERRGFDRRVGAAAGPERDFPGGARARGERARVTLAVVSGTNGRLVSAEVVGSSGFDALDKAALGMVRRATLPPLAAGLGAESASFTIPIVFAVR
ncbi:MAG: energy transducer TonB, partial [Reyranella sp.]|nr:energy transducer TonB [Reyranella sp.]